MQVLPLAGIHDRQAFDCGRQGLKDWLHQIARQHQDKGLSNRFEAAPDNPLLLFLSAKLMAQE